MNENEFSIALGADDGAGIGNVLSKTTRRHRCLGYTSLASAGKRGLMGGVKILGESVDLIHACFAWSRKSHAWRGHKEPCALAWGHVRK